jgi:hypothetical protein
VGKTTRLGLAKPTHGINVVEGNSPGEPNEAKNLDLIDAAIAALQDAVTSLQGGGGGGGGGGALSTLTVTLTAAQIKALGATPITLLAAQGAGKIIIAFMAVAKLSFGTVAFTDPSGGSLAFGVSLGAPSVQNGFVVGMTSDLILATGDEVQVEFGAAAENPASEMENQPLLFAAAPLGPVTAVGIINGGNGFVVNDRLTLANDTADCILNVDAVDPSTHAITALSIFQAGTQYPKGVINIQSGGGISGGSGTGAIIQVSGVDSVEFASGDGTLEVSVAYAVMSL